MIELLIKLDDNHASPFYIQLYDYIKNEILSGNIPPGSKLPSIRSLSKSLKLSKNTVEAAYEQLTAEGYVKPCDRSGVFVENIDSTLQSLRKTGFSGFSNEKDSAHEYSIKYDLRSGLIDVDSFPYPEFRKIMGRSIDICSRELLLYGDHKGDYGLRYEISKYIYYSRGVSCNPGQILVSSGTQQSLMLLSMILREFNSGIAFEEPGYLGAKAVFSHFGIGIDPIPLEPDGININTLKKSSAKIAYVTPSHQFPMGMVMPITKRLQLIKWAQENNAYVIEDDYDGEFKYRGKPVPSLQGLDNMGRIIYLGSFSKSLMPSMRISYLVLPAELLEIYQKKYRAYEQPVSRIIQKSLEIFIKEGLWEKHLRKSRVLYNRKREILISSINEHLGAAASVIGADSGLHILLEIKTDLSEEDLIDRALRFGVKVSPTSIYWSTPPANSFPVLLIGYAGIGINDIDRGIILLKESWNL